MENRGLCWQILYYVVRVVFCCFVFMNTLPPLSTLLSLQHRHQQHNIPCLNVLHLPVVCKRNLVTLNRLRTSLPVAWQLLFWGPIFLGKWTLSERFDTQHTVRLYFPKIEAVTGERQHLIGSTQLIAEWGKERENSQALRLPWFVQWLLNITKPGCVSLKKEWPQICEDKTTECKEIKSKQ